MVHLIQKEMLKLHGIPKLLLVIGLLIFSGIFREFFGECWGLNCYAIDLVPRKLMGK